MLVIVRYGVGNLGAVARAFGRLGVEVAVSDEPAVLRRATRLVFPGVGAAGAALAHLRARGLIELLTQRVFSERVPTLGICLGMQLFADRSEEGDAAGLGWLPGRVERLKIDPREPRKVPQIGWNEVQPTRASKLWQELPAGASFYFAHSYHLVCDRPADVVAVSHHGQPITAAVEIGNLYGIQFHAERSHAAGDLCLRGFLSYGSPAPC